MDAFFRLAVVLCLACVVHTQDGTIWIYDEEDHWFPVGSEAVVTCKWEHEINDTATLAQILAWKAEGAGIRKITRDNEGGTFVYDNTPIDEDRQSEETNWESTPQEGRLLITDFQVSDPTAYTCEIEVGKAQKSTVLHIYPFALPTVYMVDVVTEVDLRPPPPVDEEYPDTNSTETTSDETEDAGEGGDETSEEDTSETDSNDYYMSDEPADGANTITVQCVIEGAYPEPDTVEFVISENQRVGATSIDLEQGDDELFSGTATLELDAEAGLDGAQITCEVVIPTKPNKTVEISANASSVIQIYHETTSVRTRIIPEVAQDGEDVEIRCEADGNPQPEFSLRPSGIATQNNDKFTITSVRKDQGGIYECIATVQDRADPPNLSTIESENQPELTVNYLDDPTLSEPKDEITLTRGDSLTIECYVGAFPSASVRWMKAGQRVSGSTLELTNAQYHEEGEYTCEASNSIGTKTKSVNIKVQGVCQASFKDPVITSSSVEGDALYVKLECEVTGQPECTVEIRPQDSFTVQGASSQSGRVLEFDALKKLSAPVSFFCIAHNSVAEQPANVTQRLDDTVDDRICCEEPKTGGLSTGAIIGIILLVLVVLVGIPIACYFLKKRQAQPMKKAPADAEAAEPEKEGLKEASSEDSDSGSLPPPPADMDNDHRLNSAHEMTTFSTNK